MPEMLGFAIRESRNRPFPAVLGDGFPGPNWEPFGRARGQIHSPGPWPGLRILAPSPRSGSDVPSDPPKSGSLPDLGTPLPHDPP